MSPSTPNPVSLSLIFPSRTLRIFDNKIPRPITYFKIKSAADEPVHIIILVNAVNIPYQIVAWSRQEVEKFLKSNEGKLTYPTSIAVLTDQGVQINNGFSTDGNALSDDLEHHEIGLRQITRDSEWGDPERLQITFRHSAVPGLHFYSAGPQMILWVSPGSAPCLGLSHYLTSSQEQQSFNEIVGISTQLRKNRSTVYDINPIAE